MNFYFKHYNSFYFKDIGNLVCMYFHEVVNNSIFS